MTRFARAKGSKASNERIPEESTPWSVMKRQLEIAIAREEQEAPARTKTARELIRESDASSKIDANWAEFEVPKSETKKVKCGKVEKQVKADKKIKQALKETLMLESSVENTKKKRKGLKHEDMAESGNLIGESPVSQVTNTKKMKTKALKHDDTTESKNLRDEPTASQETNTKKMKKKNGKKRKAAEAAGESNDKSKKESAETKVNDLEGQQTGGKLSKRQKRNKKKVNAKDGGKEKMVNSTFNVKGNDWDNAVVFDKEQKNKNGDASNDEVSNEHRKPWSQLSLEEKNSYRFGKNVPRKFQKKVAKVRDNERHQRRKPEMESMKVVINGMEVEITKYDGFPIKKDDAERLTALRKEMVLKGIPKSEIDAAMKLERRKCEKALARIRKQVCFHCRKAGHNLSDCPELEREEVGTGICFKCGSTEHTHFECRVTKADDYKFAKCFICREQGHIAKQCPDNPKGLYPDGGSCKICGDVTHLKKDCPDVAREKEETTLTLDTINDKDIESLGTKTVEERSKKANNKKVVQF